jgi:hypothetical protein
VLIECLLVLFESYSDAEAFSSGNSTCTNTFKLVLGYIVIVIAMIITFIIVIVIAIIIIIIIIITSNSGNTTIIFIIIIIMIIIFSIKSIIIISTSIIISIASSDVYLVVPTTRGCVLCGGMGRWEWTVPRLLRSRGWIEPTRPQPSWLEAGSQQTKQNLLFADDLAVFVLSHRAGLRARCPALQATLPTNWPGGWREGQGVCGSITEASTPPRPT